MHETFNIGDLVMLKSGSLPMVVNNFSSGRFVINNKEEFKRKISVIYLHNEELVQRNFLIDLLIPFTAFNNEFGMYINNIREIDDKLTNISTDLKTITSKLNT